MANKSVAKKPVARRNRKNITNIVRKLKKKMIYPLNLHKDMI